VTFGPDIREGVAEWNGEGETVGGIVVMRDGMNALHVIDGIKKKLTEIKLSLPPGVEVVAGYDRSGLIEESIRTLQRDLLEEAIIVSLVIIVFLFHFRSALIPILTLPIAVIASFIPMYYLHVTSNIMSLGGLALAIGVLVDAAIVMVENGYRHVSEHPYRASSTMPEWDGANGPVAPVLSPGGVTPARLLPTELDRRRILLDAPGMDQDAGGRLFFGAGYHFGAGAYADFYPRPPQARVRESNFTLHSSRVSTDSAPLS
jgi:hypothetical protein